MSSSYDLGWNDGYAEGYACKLTDATEPFSPRSLNKAEAVEATAKRLHTRYGIEQSEAIGAARMMFRIAREKVAAPKLSFVERVRQIVSRARGQS
jgi:hypothetical protein